MAEQFILSDSEIMEIIQRARWVALSEGRNILNMVDIIKVADILQHRRNYAALFDN